jgi:hypothetical protein
MVHNTAAAVNLSVAQCKARERSEDEPQLWGKYHKRNRATEVAPLILPCYFPIGGAEGNCLALC